MCIFIQLSKLYKSEILPRFWPGYIGKSKGGKPWHGNLKNLAGYLDSYSCSTPWQTWTGATSLNGRGGGQLFKEKTDKMATPRTVCSSLLRNIIFNISSVQMIKGMGSSFNDLGVRGGSGEKWGNVRRQHPSNALYQSQFLLIFLLLITAWLLSTYTYVFSCQNV